MKALLASSSGYDVANLWMNLAKILILITFIHQDTLYGQLGLDMFKQLYYVFVAGAPDSTNGNAAVDAQVIEGNNPRFNITILPLSIWIRYDSVKVEVMEVWKGSKKLTPNPQAKPYLGYWPEGGRHGGPIHRADFNLGELVNEPLSSGEYTVRFAVRFLQDGKIVHTFPENLGDATQAPKETEKNVVRLKYDRFEELQFGEFPVVYGQSFDMPQPLRSRKVTWNAGWRMRKTNGGDWPKELDGGGILEVQGSRLRPVRVSPGKTYQQWGYYEEDGKNIDFSLSFILLENQSPRSTYRGGAANTDAYAVKLFADNYFDAADGSYQYFNLSRYIIDPDGKTDAGVAEVQVRSITDLEDSRLFTLLRDAHTGDFHLKINGGIGQLLRALPGVGDHVQIAVKAHDEVNLQRISVLIERRK